MKEARASFACGFGDAEAGVGGLAWDLGEPGALLLKQGQVLSATFALEEGGDAATLELAVGDTSVEATLSARTAEIALADDANTDGPTVVDCAADVLFNDRAQTVECPGQISRWGRDPLAGAGTFRHLAIDAGDEALLIAEARGAPGAKGHGEERTGAWLLRGEDVTRFEDAFISTQYDGAGDPTRFGLELWPEEAERASRAAATRVATSPVGGTRTGNVWAGLFRCNTDGVLGLGSYLLWRG